MRGGRASNPRPPAHQGRKLEPELVSGKKTIAHVQPTPAVLSRVQWTSHRKALQCEGLPFVSVDGIEPSTLCLKGRCSTPELHARNRPGCQNGVGTRRTASQHTNIRIQVKKCNMSGNLRWDCPDHADAEFGTIRGAREQDPHPGNAGKTVSPGVFRCHPGRQ
jgi:hypothetical protein